MNKILILFLFIFSLSLNAQNIAFTYTDQLVDSVEYKGLMSASIQVKKGDQIIYERAFGMADYKSNQKNTIDTRFKIGSITKTYTSALILMLEEEGKLSINDKLSTYFPNIKGAERISLHQMLQHRSGLSNYTDQANFTEMSEEDWSTNQILNLLEGYEIEFEPGSKFEYSNTNYLLLGYIIEQIEGESFFTVLHRKILEPLALYQTKMNLMDDEVAKSFLNKEEVSQWQSIWSYSAGGLVSNVDEVNRFMYALMNDQIINEESRKKMMDFKDSFGLGLVQYPFYNDYGYGHTGGIEAYRSMTGFFPKKDIYFTILSNENNNNKISNNDFAIALLSDVSDIKYTLPDMTETETIEVSKDYITTFEGIYTTPDFPLDIKIFVKDGKLLGQATGQGSFPLSCTDKEKNVFVYEPAAIQTQFYTDRDKMKMVFIQSSNTVEFERDRK